MTASGADREEQLPLRLNLSTIFPPAYASSFLLLPITIFNFTQTGEADWIRLLGQGQPLHMILYAVIIVLLTYAFLPNMGTVQAVAGNLARWGGEIPGVPAGAATAAYIRRRLLWASAPVPFYMAAICVLPEVLVVSTPLPMFIGGFYLLIIVIALSDVVRGGQTGAKRFLNIRFCGATVPCNKIAFYGAIAW
jgi:preprotein translocase subunit SecY